MPIGSQWAGPRAFFLCVQVCRSRSAHHPAGPSGQGLCLAARGPGRGRQLAATEDPNRQLHRPAPNRVSHWQSAAGSHTPRPQLVRTCPTAQKLGLATSHLARHRSATHQSAADARQCITRWRSGRRTPCSQVGLRHRTSRPPHVPLDEPPRNRASPCSCPATPATAPPTRRRPQHS